METYQKSIELYIHSYQALPLFGGRIFKYDKSHPNSLTTIKGRKAKLGVLLRMYLLQVVGFSMLLRIVSFVLMDPTNEQEKSTQRVNIYVTAFSFVCFVPTSEWYRNLGCSSQKISSFVNGLFLMKAKYFKDAKLECPGYIKATMHCSRLICYACYGPIQVTIVLACVYDPTLPINVFWFLPNPTNTTFKFIQIILTSILNYIIWIFAAKAGGGQLAQLLMGMIPQLFSHKILTRRIAQVIEGNHTLDQLTNEIVAYRAFKLVVELFNDSVSSVLVTFLVSAGSVQVISAALLIQQTKSDLGIPLALNVIFAGIVAETTFIILCVYSFPGELYENSKKISTFSTKTSFKPNNIEG